MAILKHDRAFAATWMDLEIMIQGNIHQKKTNIIGYHLNVESKIDTSELIYKTDSQI